MKYDKYTIISLIMVILILGVILSFKVLSAKMNLSLEVDSSEIGTSISKINQAMDFEQYVGENLNYLDIQKMLEEIEIYVVGVSKVTLADRTVITMNVSTNKTAGALADYSNTLRTFKQTLITEEHTYRVTLENGIADTAKILTLVVL